MFLYGHSKGFSLIELLVVLMVMTLIMSLVGPSINKVYAQHMAQQEMRMLKQYIRDISVYAYTNQEDINIVLTGNRIEAVKPVANYDGDANHGAEANQYGLTKPQFDISAIAGQMLESEPDNEGNEQKNLLVFEQRFEYLTFRPVQFAALKNGRVNMSSVQVSVGSGNISKDVALRGITYTELWQGT